MLGFHGIMWSEVEAELARRFGISGITEKQSRGNYVGRRGRWLQNMRRAVESNSSGKQGRSGFELDVSREWLIHWVGSEKSQLSTGDERGCR